MKDSVLRKSLRVLFLKFDAETRLCKIRMHAAIILRRAKTVEEHRLDTHVIMKVLNVTQGPCGTGEMHVNGRATMSRKGKRMRDCERTPLHEAGNAAAACGVRLDHINRVGSHHSSQIGGVPTILA